MACYCKELPLDQKGKVEEDRQTNLFEDEEDYNEGYMDDLTSAIAIENELAACGSTPSLPDVAVITDKCESRMEIPWLKISLAPPGFYEIKTMEGRPKRVKCDCWNESPGDEIYAAALKAEEEATTPICPCKEDKLPEAVARSGDGGDTAPPEGGTDAPAEGDTDAPAADDEAPADGGEAPPDDGAAPTDDAEAPPEETEPPPEEPIEEPPPPPPEPPVEEVEPPPEEPPDAEAPTDEGEAPPVEGEAPPEDGEAPADGGDGGGEAPPPPAAPPSEKVTFEDFMNEESEDSSVSSTCICIPPVDECEDIMGRPTEFVFEDPCFAQNESYLNPLSKLYPDECDTFCGPHIEMPWSELLIPRNIKLKYVKKPEKKKCKCKDAQKKENKELQTPKEEIITCGQKDGPLPSSTKVSEPVEESRSAVNTKQSVSVQACKCRARDSSTGPVSVPSNHSRRSSKCRCRSSRSKSPLVSAKPGKVSCKCSKRDRSPNLQAASRATGGTKDTSVDTLTSLQFKEKYPNAFAHLNYITQKSIKKKAGESRAAEPRGGEPSVCTICGMPSASASKRSKSKGGASARQANVNDSTNTMGSEEFRQKYNIPRTQYEEVTDAMGLYTYAMPEMDERISDVSVMMARNRELALRESISSPGNGGTNVMLPPVSPMPAQQPFSCGCCPAMSGSPYGPLGPSMFPPSFLPPPSPYPFPPQPDYSMPMGYSPYENSFSSSRGPSDGYDCGCSKKHKKSRAKKTVCTNSGTSTRSNSIKDIYRR